MNQEISIVDLNQKAESYLAQGKLNEADTVCNQALEKLQDLALVCNTKGKVVEAMGNQELAKEYYQKAIAINSNFTAAHINLANLYSQQKQWDLAIISYRHAIELNPKQPQTYYKLGEVLSKLENWSEAIAAYRHAIKLSPDSPWHYHKLGYALHKQGLLDEAIACYRKAIDLKSNSPWVYSSLGDILLEQGESNQAIDCYIKAIQLHPNAKGVYQKLRGIHKFKLVQLNSSQFDELIKSYREAIQLQPDCPEPYINLGNILTEKNQIEQAIDYYQQGLYQQLLKTYPEYVKNYWNFEQASQPNFVIIGTVKGGTSSLFNYINQHPYVIPGTEKEMNFFNHNFDKGINWYLAHFPPLPDQEKFITGEASPTYMHFNSTGRKLFDCFPKVKVIAILRNPVDRTVSHFYMAKRLGIEHRNLAEVVTIAQNQLKKMSIKQGYNPQIINKIPSFLRVSLYLNFLREWLQIFPREQLLILKSEDMFENPAETMRQVFEFLGLPDYQLPEYRVYYSGYYSPISSDIRCILSEFFQPHNQKLEEYLGMRFNWE